MGLLSFSKLFLIIAWFRAQGLGFSWTLLPSYGRRCPEGAEVGWGWRYEREGERSSQIDDIREHPIHRWRGPPPSPMGKAGIRGCRFSRHNAFPKGEGKEDAASLPKKEANPASLRSAAPSKGRGSRRHSLFPIEGGAPKGRRLDGDGGVKKSEGDRLKCAINESTLSTAARSPFPNGEGCDTRVTLSPK